MRDYGKIAPQFWTGKTGKAIKARGAEAVVVSLYLMTSPHANMLGLYYLPMLYMAHETGLGQEGDMKGLRGAIEAGLCLYDEASEMVWVKEMASFQIAAALKPDDKRVIGIQKDYDALPDNAFLAAFFSRYAKHFHMTSSRGVEGAEEPTAVMFPEGLGRGFEDPTKPGTGTGAETGAGGAAPTPAAPAPPPSRNRSAMKTFDTWTNECRAAGVDAIPKDHAVWAYAERVGLSDRMLTLHWLVFKRRYSGTSKKYIDWGRTFLNSVKDNWFSLWWLKDGQFVLSTRGLQAEREFKDLL